MQKENAKTKVPTNIVLQRARLAMMGLALAANVVPIYATGSGTTEGTFGSLIAAISKAYAAIAPVVFVLAALALAVCGFLYLMSKDERRADAAFQWGKRIVVGTIFFIIAPWLLGKIIGMFSDTGMVNKWDELNLPGTD